MGQLFWDTVDGIVKIGYSRQDSQLEYHNVDMITVLDRTSHYDTVDQMVRLRHSS